MKIATFGADHFTCQLPRITEEMRKRGYEVHQNNPKDDIEYDLAYSNNPPYDDLLKCRAKIKIANVLDIPIHLIENGQYTEKDLNKLKRQLEQVDVVTFISETTKNNVINYIGQFNHTSVIYNPIQDVFEAPTETKELEKPRKGCLYVGRANDPNKRFYLIKEAFELAKQENHPEIKEENLYIVGSENPGFGNYLGSLPVTELKKLYRSCKLLLFPSKYEGLGLPMIEGYVNRCWPILCNDNLCAKEFELERELIADPSPESFFNHTKKILNTQIEPNMKVSLNGSMNLWSPYGKMSFCFPDQVVNKIIKSYKIALSAHFC